MIKKGFTLVELLVVISIIGLLSSVVFAALGSGRKKGLDARRMAEVREMVKILAIEDITSEGASLTGCTAAASKANTCAGPGEVSQFSRFSDPAASGSTAACASASAAVCQYSISSAAGDANPKTNNYQICFYLESGAGGLSKGLWRVTSANSSFVSGCPAA